MATVQLQAAAALFLAVMLGAACPAVAIQKHQQAAWKVSLLLQLI